MVYVKLLDVTQLYFLYFFVFMSIYPPKVATEMYAAALKDCFSQILVSLPWSVSDH